MTKDRVDKKTTETLIKSVSEGVTMEPEVASSQDAKTSVKLSLKNEDLARKLVAKAGKRSVKAQTEEQEKQKKQARKSEVSKSEPKKTQAKPPRSRVERAGKKYREVSQLIERDKIYSIAEAAELIAKTSPVRFDAAVELHVNLNVDPKQADQNVREMVSLPAGTGKSLRVAVFAEADDATKALKAGADIAGADELIAQLDKEIVEFDVLISTPPMMARLAKYARLLGPKGLMPNPKSGTVSSDVAKAVSEAKAGKVEYRVDSSGIIHLRIGKVSFGPDKLAQNTQAVLASIKGAKPASVKGAFITSTYLSTSMGPSVKVEQ